MVTSLMRLLREHSISNIQNENVTATAKDIEETIAQTSIDVKQKKETARELIDEGSKMKVKIDELKDKLNEKKDEMMNVINDDEYKLIDELKGVRQHYKEVLDNFKQTKIDIN